MEKWGKINFVVNSAGVGAVGLFIDKKGRSIDIKTM
jgi:transcription antitermination factor NusA-like protein